MTVSELIELLKKMPQDAITYANGIVVGLYHHEEVNRVYIDGEDD